MLTQYLRNPRTVKALAAEIKKICDDYWSRIITEEFAREYLLYWAKNEGSKLFMGKDYNPTVKKIIGSKRLDLINKFLQGTQFTMF